MFPAAFDEANAILSAPDGMTHDECDPLEVCRTQTPDGKTVVISCWKLTADELERINRTGRVWLMIWGQTMPPIAVLGESPFER